MSLAVGPLSASPLFARKYDVQCTRCHSSFPRLSDYGVRFRDAGYRLPESVEPERLIAKSRFPVAFRFGLALNDERTSQLPDDSGLFEAQLTGLDIMSGGLLATDVGYWFHYTPRLGGSKYLTNQPGQIESGNIVFTNVMTTRLNLRVGKFEPGFNGFSSHRSLTYAPYDIYEVGVPGGTSLSDNQVGIEITGTGGHRLDYVVGALFGPDAANAGNGAPDLYLRVSKMLSPVRIQTTGQRLGVSAYFGTVNRMPQIDSNSRKSYQRYGADATFNTPPWVLNAQYMLCRDDAALWNTADNIYTHGGFIEILYQPRRELVALARYDCVQTPSEINTSIDRWTLGVRRYLKQNVALHLEFSAQSKGGGPGIARAASDNMLTFGVDTAM